MNIDFIFITWLHGLRFILRSFKFCGTVCRVWSKSQLLARPLNWAKDKKRKADEACACTLVCMHMCSCMCEEDTGVDGGSVSPAMNFLAAIVSCEYPFTI